MESNTASSSKTVELLHEARNSESSCWESSPQGHAADQRCCEAVVLIVSGATHVLKPARDWDEFNIAQGTTVMLAEGSTDRFRLRPGTKLLLSDPSQRQAWILPMGGLMRWTGH